ncbi:hypothetical protein J6590_056091 [Homalodisca vitripennis]|nr:hypothetical protein J6590_056091 [Homalodisca vitripennis]
MVTPVVGVGGVVAGRVRATQPRRRLPAPVCTSLQDLYFRHSIEDLVSNLLKIGLTGHRVLWLEEPRFCLRFPDGCVDALENNMLSATFPLGRVSMAALSWFGVKCQVVDHASEALQEEWENIDQQVITDMIDSTESHSSQGKLVTNQYKH